MSPAHLRVNPGRLKRTAVAGAGVLLCFTVGAACDGGGARKGGITRTGPPVTAPSSPPLQPSPVPRSSALGPPGAPGCRPASPIRPERGGGGFPEVQGTSRDVQLWGLIMPASHYPPLRAGEDVKIVWRMTGTGGIRLTATGPDGGPSRLTFGPEPHGGSNYRRPGYEWGAGYHFDEPGCWHLRAVRGTSVADVWLAVKKA